jgi:polysaccharide export outer membrane protein
MLKDNLLLYNTRLRQFHVRVLMRSVGCLLLVGCAVLPSGGPSSKAAGGASLETVAGVPIHAVQVSASIAAMRKAGKSASTFAGELGDGTAVGTIVGRGDTLSIRVGEAPPALLFSGGGVASSREAILGGNTQMPEQMVAEDGTVRVPFAGEIRAAGRRPQDIAADIRSRLIGKAHDPQVMVSLAENATANVTVVGEVTKSVRMPLTPKGERLLDTLASVGGVKQPVGKMKTQVTRGRTVETISLETVIRDPRQNIRLQADDVVTLLFQPYSFTALGAASKNEEIPFESTGLTLSQGLGRMGGLQDQRANPRGVFIFRFEDPKLLVKEGGAPLPTTKDGKVPVIYRIDMRDPKTPFVAQSSPIEEKDVIYVSNAPLADFSEFLQAVSQIVYPIATIQNSVVLGS